MEPRTPLRRESPATRGEETGVLWDTTNPEGYANRSGVYKTRVEYEFIRKHFPPAPARVLDIAGGSGRFALPLLRSGYDVTVNDISPPSLRLLQERCSGLPVSLLPGSFLEATPPGPFDCALGIECLENFPIEQALARVHDVLKPGGVFVFTGMNAGSWRFQGRRLLGRAEAGEHVMNARRYRLTCHNLGLDIQGMRGLMWTPFPVTSNSPIVPVFANLESTLGLSAIHSQSPWLLIAARRRA